MVPGVRLILDRPPGPFIYNESKHLRELPGDGTEVTAIDSEQPFSIRAHTPWRPMGPPVAIASAEDRPLLGGDLEGPLPVLAEGAREVPLALSGIWLFAFEPPEDEGEVRGHLILFTEEDAPKELGNELLEAVRAALLEQDWEEFRPRSEDDERDPFLDIDKIDWESI